MQRVARGDILQSSYEGNLRGGARADGQDNPEPVSADYLEYLSDMIAELRLISEKTGMPTLAGILELAYREALLQVELRRGR